MRLMNLLFIYLLLHIYIDNSDLIYTSSQAKQEIFWFIQISDLHISTFRDPGRVEDLNKFCSKFIPVIKPEIVIATGDITDAKNYFEIRAFQQETEWKSYKEVILNTKVLNQTVWLDLRGNHDNYDVSGWNYRDNLYRYYGVQGQLASKVYSYTINKPFGKYSFVSVDSCLEPGIKWPLNFFSQLKPTETEELNRALQDVKNSNQTFVFGHYPTSTVISSTINFHTLLGFRVYAYLCGHFHTAAGLAPQMYALQSTGYWEWELGDWKDNRVYRVIAIDSDLVSFVDLNINQWPIILITNPKDARFLLVTKEPVYNIRHSKHIRILVWSLSNIVNVTVAINGYYFGNAIQVSKSQPLFILPWDTSRFPPKSVNTIEVTAIDAKRNQRTIQQYFTFDEILKLNEGIIGYLLLKLDIGVILYVLFFTIWITLFILAILTIFWFNRRDCEHLKTNMLSMYSKQYQMRKKKVAIILSIYLIYILIGPIYMGYIVSDKFGAVFLFGVYVSGEILPEKLIISYEILQLLLLTAFLVCFLILTKSTMFAIENNNLYPIKEKYVEKLAETIQSEIQIDSISLNKPSLYLFISLTIFTIVQIIFSAIFVWIPIGLLSIPLSPGRIFPLIFAWYICYT